ncbi:MAG: glycosyltransferase [Clostridia bacterium]|nr:glycosyltransferase [Clostridia bacterium]
MNTLERKFLEKKRGLERAWEDGGLIGLGRLARKKGAQMLCIGDIREMRRSRAQNDAAYDTWIREELPSDEERKKQKARLFSHRISYLIPTYNTRPDLLKALSESILAQTNDAWEVCFYDGASTNQETLQMLREIDARDTRFHVCFGKENAGISGNTNKALFMAETDYIALCDHDDLLTPDCTYYLLDAAEHGADFIYSDEDKVTEDGSRFFDPHLKADFSPDALRSGNYICHIMAMRTSLVKELGGLRSAYDGSQDHDLALRATECAQAIAHIPRVLYHWRMLNSSFSHASQEKCVHAAAHAIDDQMTRLGLDGHCEMVDMAPYITYDLPENCHVTWIIHGIVGGADLKWLKRLLRFSRDAHKYTQEIIIVSRNPLELEAVEGIPITTARDVHAAAAMASASLLLFIEQGMRPLQSVWFERLMMFASRPWIACAGGGAVDKKQRYLTCGYALLSSGPSPRFYGQNRFGITYQLYDRSVREVSAVSMSLLMVSRETYGKLGGFAPYASDVGAVALGVRANRMGLSNVVVPEAIARAPEESLLHHPMTKKDRESFRQEAMTEHYYATAFHREQADFCIDTSRHESAPTVIVRYASQEAGI